MSDDLERGLQIAAILTPIIAFMLLRRQQMASVRKAALGLLFDRGFASLLVAIGVLAVGTITLDEAVAGFAAAAILSLLITTAIYWRQLPAEVLNSRPKYHYKKWMLIALPMLIGLSSRNLMSRIDVLLLGPMTNLYEVGLYGAAFRLTYLLSFPQVVLMTVVTPLFSEAFVEKRAQGVARLLKWSIAFGLATTVPVVVVLVIFGEEIMTLIFGQEYAAATTVLTVLAIGQTAAALTIPFSAMLMMGGRERLFGALTAAALTLNVTLCLALIPLLGALGAALASAATSMLLLGVQFYFGTRLVRKGIQSRV